MAKENASTQVSGRLQGGYRPNQCAKSFAKGGEKRAFLRSYRKLMADLLDANEIKQEMKRIPEWDLLKNKSIERTFEFDDFTQAIDFVNSVSEIAEEEEHHPDIDIRYNRVRLLLSTHSEGGLTETDFDLAERIDTLTSE